MLSSLALQQPKGFVLYDLPSTGKVFGLFGIAATIHFLFSIQKTQKVRLETCLVTHFAFQFSKDAF